MTNWTVIVGVILCLCEVSLAANDTADICQNVVANLDCSKDPPRNICATNGITYPTSCDFAKAHCDDPDLHMRYEGSCPPPAEPDHICASMATFSCPKCDNPLCASDGQTYTNFCFYEQAKCLQPSLSLLNLGSCPTTAPKSTLSILDIICESLQNEVCPTNLPEVCGSDGKTYNNGCELEKASCLASQLITLVHEGPC